MSLNEKKVLAALADDHHSKSAYTGRIQQTERVTIVDERGISHEKDVSFFVSWDSISAILKLVRERADIN